MNLPGKTIGKSLKEKSVLYHEDTFIEVIDDRRQTATSTVPVLMGNDVSLSSHPHS